MRNACSAVGATIANLFEIGENLPGQNWVVAWTQYLHGAGASQIESEFLTW